MPLGNYGELKTEIATLLNRSDLTSAIPDFVTMLEARVNREVQFRNRRMEADASLTFSTDKETLPTDFVEARALTWQSSPRTRLEFMTLSTFRDTYRDDTPGDPVNFTIYGNTVQVGPYPNSTVGAELIYYQRLTALSNDSDTNWLLQNHPDVYLYGSSIQSAPYLQEDTRLQTWIGLYRDAAAAVAGDDSRARFNGTPIRQAAAVTVV